MIKYFSEMRTAAPEVPPAPKAPAEAPAPEAPKAPAPAPSENVDVAPSPEKDAVKFKLKAEQKAKAEGFSTNITISSSNRSMMVTIDPGDDIITQRDALKLAVTLDAIDKNWRLMDEPLQKASSSWGIKISKVN